MSDDLRIGVDLGGTKIEAVVVRYTPAPPAVQVLSRRRVPTPTDCGYEAVLAAVAELIHERARDAGLDPVQVPIGVGMPGGVTRRGGLVKNSNALCLNGRPFRADLESLLGRPLAFENDANCFTLAEALLGAGAAYCDGMVFGVILGTGVGGGLVVRRELWPGAQGIAGEWGHHVICSGGRSCYCGGHGCLERYLAGPAIEQDYATHSGAYLPLVDIAARRAQDPHAGAAIDGLLDAFGRGLANLIDVLDPSAVVLGGGVSNLPLLYDEGVDRVARCVFNDELTTPIVKHALGDSAGVLGAALLAK